MSFLDSGGDDVRELTAHLIRGLACFSGKAQLYFARNMQLLKLLVTGIGGPSEAVSLACMSAVQNLCTGNTWVQGQLYKCSAIAAIAVALGRGGEIQGYGLELLGVAVRGHADLAMQALRLRVLDRVHTCLDDQDVQVVLMALKALRSAAHASGEVVNWMLDRGVVQSMRELVVRDYGAGLRLGEQVGVGVEVGVLDLLGVVVRVEWGRVEVRQAGFDEWVNRMLVSGGELE